MGGGETQYFVGPGSEPEPASEDCSRRTVSFERELVELSRRFAQAQAETHEEHRSDLLVDCLEVHLALKEELNHRPDGLEKSRLETTLLELEAELVDFQEFLLFGSGDFREWVLFVKGRPPGSAPSSGPRRSMTPLPGRMLRVLDLRQADSEEPESTAFQQSPPHRS